MATTRRAVPAIGDWTASVADQARGAWRTVWEAARLFVDDQGLSWAGAIGLYLFLSVPPFMVAAVYIGGAVAPSADAEAFVVEQVAKYLPAEQELLQGIVSSRPDSVAAGAVSIGLLLFSGSRAFAAMTSAVNVMWRRVDRLTFWRRQALRVGMLAATLVLTGIAAVSEAAISALDSGGTGENEVWLLDWQVLPTALLFAFLMVAYKVLPREPVSVRHAALGALFATTGVRLAQAALGVLAKGGWLEVPYGDLAGVALVATWSLVAGVVILFGAALVAVLDGKSSTNGDDSQRFSRGS
jgi:membrane protein